MRSLLPFATLLVLAGCPDPEKQYPDGTVPQGSAPTGEGTVAPTGDAVAGAPAPPGDAGTGGGAPTVPTLTVEPGTGVKVSGTFTYDGAVKGQYRLDIFRVGPDGRPMILHAATLEKTGDWEFELPKDLGNVNIMAFVDANGNGPELAEPSATLSDVAVGDKPVSGLALKPADGAKNEFAVDAPNLPPPGAAPAPPEGAAGAPPAGAPPADGAPPAGVPPADGAAPAAPADGAAPAGAATVPATNP